MSQIPAATHPIWEKLVTGQVRHRFSLFAANMAVDHAAREFASRRNNKEKLANDLCQFFNKYADLTASELASII